MAIFLDQEFERAMSRIRQKGPLNAFELLNHVYAAAAIRRVSLPAKFADDWAAEILNGLSRERLHFGIVQLHHRIWNFELGSWISWKSQEMFAGKAAKYSLTRISEVRKSLREAAASVIDQDAETVLLSLGEAFSEAEGLRRGLSTLRNFTNRKVVDEIDGIFEWLQLHTSACGVICIELSSRMANGRAEPKWQRPLRDDWNQTSQGWNGAPLDQ